MEQADKQLEDQLDFEARRLVQRYIDEVVLEFDLCPWAAPALRAGRVDKATCAASIHSAPGHDEPHRVEQMATPGATMSGFRMAPPLQMTGPRELKLAGWSVLSLAPTVIARRAVPGLPIVCSLAPELPAATTTVTPRSVALSTACDMGSSGSP